MKDRRALFLKYLQRGLPILLCLFWLGFIFSNSMQNGEASGEQSKEVHKIVNDVAQSIGIQKPITEAQIRTSAHFTEFAVLAFLECWVLAAFGMLRKGLPVWMPAVGFLAVVADCFLMACVDETIQRFSSGRAAEWKDVGVDTLGGVLAVTCILIAFLTVRLISVRKEKRA